MGGAPQLDQFAPCSAGLVPGAGAAFGDIGGGPFSWGWRKSDSPVIGMLRSDSAVELPSAYPPDAGGRVQTAARPRPIGEPPRLNFPQWFNRVAPGKSRKINLWTAVLNSRNVGYRPGLALMVGQRLYRSGGRIDGQPIRHCA